MELSCSDAGALWRAVGEAKKLVHLIETRWSDCPTQLKSALLPGRAIKQLEDSVWKEDTCLRRWQDPGGQWERLFRAEQGRVTANDLEGIARLDAKVVQLSCCVLPLSYPCVGPALPLPCKKPCLSCAHYLSAMPYPAPAPPLPRLCTAYPCPGPPFPALCPALSCLLHVLPVLFSTLCLLLPALNSTLPALANSSYACIHAKTPSDATMVCSLGDSA